MGGEGGRGEERGGEGRREEERREEGERGGGGREGGEGGVDWLRRKTGLCVASLENK